VASGAHSKCAAGEGLRESDSQPAIIGRSTEELTDRLIFRDTGNG